VLIIAGGQSGEEMKTRQDEFLDLHEIKAQIDRLAEQIGARGFILPTYGDSEDFARPHIEVDSRGYHYVVVERGRELERFTTNVLEELLYRVFKTIVSTLSYDYEVQHRVQGQDCRRIAFTKQLELLEVLSPTWASRRSEENARILEEHPFNDLKPATHV